MLIIGIAGKKKSGKDSICNAIKSFYGEQNVKRIAFADSLKSEVCRACMISLDYLESNKENFRLILQGWGTDFRRKLHGNDYWIKQWLNKVSDSRLQIVVTPDVRFNNEMDTIKSLGGYIWRVRRLRTELGGHKIIESDDNHPSETEIDNRMDFDCVIDNGETLERLEQDVHLKLQMLKYKI